MLLALIPIQDSRRGFKAGIHTAMFRRQTNSTHKQSGHPYPCTKCHAVTTLHFSHFWQLRVTGGLRLRKLENNGRRTIILDIGKTTLKSQMLNVPMEKNLQRDENGGSFWLPVLESVTQVDTHHRESRSASNSQFQRTPSQI